MTTDREEYFRAYQEYSKVLRTGLVAYGIGAPVLLLTNEALAKAIKASGEASTLAVLFLIGGSLQVILAAVNKASMWGIYYAEIAETFKHTRRYKSAHWFSEHFWIDFVIDVITLLSFGIATWRGFQVLVV